jgi:periplasmic protein TonB
MARRGGYITTGERTRNYIGLAFVISFVVHGVIGSVFPNILKHNESQQTEQVTVSKIHKAIVHTPPPPTHTPPPTPTPPPQATPPPKQQQRVEQPQLKVNLVHTHNAGATGSTENTVAQPKSGTEQGVPQGQGTGTPGPAATVGTPKPACANPNVEATVTNPVQPDYPESARDLGLGAVTAEVEVTVGPSGNLISAKIYKSAGNMAIDQAALRAARQSPYSPKLVDCSPTQGDYLFRADFQPD